jgi:hypothetical protein
MWGMSSRPGPSPVAPARLRIVLASPGDVQEERGLIPVIVEQIRAELRKMGSHRILELSRYEVDSRPGYDVGGGPQALIDRDLDIEGADLVVGIFWNRFGTRTPSSETGTEREIRLACKSKQERNKPEVMVYFKAMSGPTSPEDAEQQRQVLTFKNELKGLGVWTWDYTSIEDFVREFPHQLRLFAFEKPPEHFPAIPPVLSCFVSAEARTLRAEGLTELIGDIHLTCRGLDGAGFGGQFDVRVYTIPTCVTNLVTGVSEYGFSGLTDAVILDQANRTVRGQLLPNLVSGDVPNTRNCLLFHSVGIWTPSDHSNPNQEEGLGGVTSQTNEPTTIVIKNIRVVVPHYSVGEIPNTVSCYVDVHDSFTGAPQIIENPGVLVGTVEPSFTFSVTGSDGGAALPLIYRIPFTPSEPPKPFFFSLSFKERFVGAFRTQVEEAEYGAEQGIGFAHNGTRLSVRFYNLPWCFRIAVTEAGLGTSETQDRNVSALLCNPDPRPESNRERGQEYVQLRAAGGQASAEWECTGARNEGQLLEIRMGVRLEFLSLEQASTELRQPDETPLEFVRNYGSNRMNLAFRHPLDIAGCLAPVSTIDYAVTSDPVPRFRCEPQAYSAVRFATPY